MTSERQRVSGQAALGDKGDAERQLRHLNRHFFVLNQNLKGYGISLARVVLFFCVSSVRISVENVQDPILISNKIFIGLFAKVFEENFEKLKEIER